MRFCGLQVRLDSQGAVWIYQEDYVRDVLSRHQKMPERRTPLEKLPDDLLGQPSKTDPPMPEKVKMAQALAGELLSLVVRCKPDLAYPVNLMSQCMLRSPVRALEIGEKNWVTFTQPKIGVSVMGQFRGGTVM